MDKIQGNLSLSIILAALWGWVEATVGWGMHLLHLPYWSLLLFLTGAAFIMTGVCRTKRPGPVFAIATVATLIKLTNRFAL